MALSRSYDYAPLIERDHSTRALLRKQRAKFVLLLLLLVLVIVNLIIVLSFMGSSYYHRHWSPFAAPSPSILARYDQTAIASGVTECSEVGKSILMENGSTVDAAIATMICLELGQPQSTGIGGGLFMTIFDKETEKCTFIDARETAPANSTFDMYERFPLESRVGPMAIAVPGGILGLWEAHQRFGKLPWKRLFKKPILMAQQGITVPQALAEVLQFYRREIFNDSSLREIFVNPATDKLWKEGEKYKRLKLAKTLRIISEDGAVAFYNGRLTSDIIKDIHQTGKAIMTRDDLAMYSVRIKRALETKLKKGLTVLSPPLPSSGALLHFLLNILDGYDLSHKSISTVDKTVLMYHRMAEAFKFAFAKRSGLGDDEFVPSAARLENKLLSKSYADAIREKITDDRTHGTQYYRPLFLNQHDHGTAHMSMIGPDGSAVSVTTSLNYAFGSKVRGIRTGIIFNNEMNDFLPANMTNSDFSPANSIEPGKRPMSSMCPTIFTDQNKNVRLVIGGSGGTKILTATAAVCTYVLWLEANIKEAIDAFRIHDQLTPQTIFYEDGFSERILHGLSAKGHNITEFGSSHRVHGVMKVGNTIYANVDYRRGGNPAGY